MPEILSATSSESSELDNMFKMYKTYRDYEEHENHLLNHRTTWMVTINSVVIATFGFSIQKYLEVVEKVTERQDQKIADAMRDDLRNYAIYLATLAVIGLVFSVYSFFPLRSAVVAQRGLRTRWDALFGARAAELGFPRLAGGGVNWAAQWGGYLAMGLPVALGILWAFIIIIFIRVKFDMAVTLH